MKKTIIYLLLFLPFIGLAQVSTGQEQEFDYGIKNNSLQEITTPPYLATFGMDGTQGRIPSAYIEKTANKQNTPVYDGTGAKYPTLDLMNGNFLESTKLFARTGITNKSDQFDLTVLNINTLRILPVDRAFFYNEITGAGKIANDGFKSFPQKDYVLTQLVTATGGNINLNPIVADGKTARFIGYDRSGNIISSITNFANSPDVCQLGFVTVVKSGSSIQFLDITPGGRNCAANPILANLNDLDRTDIGLSSTVKVGFNTGTPTLNASNGTIKKAGANWRGVTNPGNNSPIDYISYTGQSTLNFTPINPAFATSSAAITPISNWTTTVDGIAFNTSFWNTTTGAKGTMNNGVFSIKRVIQGVRGGVFLQDAEHATTACFANLAEAQANLYKVGLFSDAIVPPEVGTEIARIVYQKSITNFSDETKFIIYPSGNSAGGNSSAITPVSDATTVSKGIIQLAGDLGGTATAPTVPGLVNKADKTTTISTTSPLSGGGDLSANRTLSISQATTSTNGYLSSTDWNTFNNKQNTLTNPITGTGTTNYLPKFNGISTLGDSLIYDNGTNVGIGATSPTSNLHIRNTTGNCELKINTPAGTGDAILNFQNDGQGNYYQIYERSSGAFKFKHDGAEIARFSSNGNLGIGTTTDNGNKLRVGGQAWIDGIVKVNTVDGGAVQLLANGVEDWIFGEDSGEATRNFNIYNYNTSSINFSVNRATGNIGIGTTTDNGTDKLQVNGKGTFKDAVKVTDASGFGVSLEPVGGIPTIWAVDVSKPLDFRTADLQRMRIDTNGNVGIGTTTDNGIDKLQVNGTVSGSPATASNQFVTKAQSDLKADLASPTFTGTPSLPTGTIGVTQTAGNNTTALATTAFVTTAVTSGNYAPSISSITSLSGVTLQRGSYVKVGSIVTVTVSFAFTGFTPSSFSVLDIDLPFSRNSSATNNCGITSIYATGGSVTDTRVGRVYSSSTTKATVFTHTPSSASSGGIVVASFQYDTSF